MKIVHLTSVHKWNDVRIFVKMCRSLARDGHEVHLIAARSGAPEVEFIDGVHVHSVPAPRNRWERLLRTSRRVVHLAAQIETDLYHFHDPELLNLMRAFCRRTGRPVVYDSHEDYRAQILSKAWLPLGSRHLAAWWFGRIEDRASKRLAGVVAATPQIARRFADHPRVAVVQNFPLLEEFDSTACAPSDLARGRFVYIGEITALRGAREMIEAIALAPEPARLVLGGGWEDERLRARLRTVDGWRRVEDLGYLSRDAVREQLLSATAGLALLHPLPRYVESQPTKLFEYMAAGLPVIAAHFPLWKRIIDDARCGLTVDPRSPAAIAEAMRWIMEHPAEARQMGIRGRQTAEMKYDWNTEYRNLVEFYRLLTAGRQETSHPV